VWNSRYQQLADEIERTDRRELERDQMGFAEWQLLQHGVRYLSVGHIQDEDDRGEVVIRRKLRRSEVMSARRQSAWRPYCLIHGCSHGKSSSAVKGVLDGLLCAGLTLAPFEVYLFVLGRDASALNPGKFAVHPP
jgi:hypothetical protein